MLCSMELEGTVYSAAHQVPALSEATFWGSEECPRRAGHLAESWLGDTHFHKVALCGHTQKAWPRRPPHGGGVVPPGLRLGRGRGWALQGRVISPEPGTKACLATKISSVRVDG